MMNKRVFNLKAYLVNNTKGLGRLTQDFEGIILSRGTAAAGMLG